MEREIPILFKEKKDCCACCACLNSCPTNAISMFKDEYGYFYPIIDREKCIKCGKCLTVCGFQNIEVDNFPIETYAAVSKNDDIIINSASGGIFSTIANEFLKDDGIVIGAELQKDFSVRHVVIKQISDLSKLQGSKYTQSMIGNIYTTTKDYLAQGKRVLFSGTPCQVAGLYSFLNTKPENLLTIDIVCHGVPNNKMFKEYIKTIEAKEKGKISKFTFRDKSIGWGINGAAIINNKKKIIWQSQSSYLHLFAKGEIYRESCYNCKYASKHRPADITIGDYWGIEKQHPQYLGKDGWNESKGISLVIVNTVKGKLIFNKMGNKIDYKISDFEKAAAGNMQLNYPSKKKNHDTVLGIYKEKGWEGLEKYYKKSMKIRRFSSQIKNIIPKDLKRKLKTLK